MYPCSNFVRLCVPKGRFVSSGRDQGQELWANRVRQALAERSPQAREVAEEALRAWPASQELLLLAALAALAEVRPERALVLLKRYAKRYGPGKPAVLLTALALAQQGQPTRAWAMLQEATLHTGRAALPWFVGDDVMEEWLYSQLHRLREEQLQPPGRVQARPPRPSPTAAASAPAPPRPAKSASVQASPARSPPARASKLPVAAAGPVLPEVADLPRLEARFDMAFEIANADAIEIAGSEANADPATFRLRAELVRLSLFEGFDELLCLPALQGVEAHWYQVETVRKVLKQYRGRVLLADEVGLGKTVEAGMVLKEYALRGMAERILILVPASLVGQWRDEMEAKFGIDCATSHDQAPPNARTRSAASGRSMSCLLGRRTS